MCLNEGRQLILNTMAADTSRLKVRLSKREVITCQKHREIKTNTI